MKSSFLLLTLTAASQAATVATIDVWYGSLSGKPADTFTKFSAGGGPGSNGTRIGLASSVTNTPREVAGSSNTTAWTIPSAGTITISYYLDNTLDVAFRPGIQGLYDASSGLAGSSASVFTALNSFVGLSGVSASTLPSPYPSSLNTAAAAANLFTTTYVIAADSAAIGKDVAVGFHSSWNGAGAYIFGDDAKANQVTIGFEAVPEPAAAFLGSLGMLVLLRRRR